MRRSNRFSVALHVLMHMAERFRLPLPAADAVEASVRAGGLTYVFGTGPSLRRAFCRLRQATLAS